MHTHDDIFHLNGRNHSSLHLLPRVFALGTAENESRFRNVAGTRQTQSPLRVQSRVLQFILGGRRNQRNRVRTRDTNRKNFGRVYIAVDVSCGLGPDILKSEIAAARFDSRRAAAFWIGLSGPDVIKASSPPFRNRDRGANAERGTSRPLHRISLDSREFRTRVPHRGKRDTRLPLRACASSRRLDRTH